MATKAKNLPNIKLMCFDGCGPRILSQLDILGRIFDQLKRELFPNEPNRILLPCEYVDMMAGSDTGGLLVAMFTTLRMSVEEATDALKIICQKVYGDELMSAMERSLRLRICLEVLLKSRGLPVDLKLDDDITKLKPELKGTGTDEKQPSLKTTVTNPREKEEKEDTKPEHQCYGILVATDKGDPITSCYFRTYIRPGFTNPDATLVEAILSTCAVQPDFPPLLVGPAGQEREFVCGVGEIGGTNNHNWDLLLEAHKFFRKDRCIVAFISIGSGTIDAPNSKKDGYIANPTVAAVNNWWNMARTEGNSSQNEQASVQEKCTTEEKPLSTTTTDFPTLSDMYKEMSKDAEQSASRFPLWDQPIYVRLSGYHVRQKQEPSGFFSKARAYLEDIPSKISVNKCVELLRGQGTSISREKLGLGGGKLLTPVGIPPLAANFVMRLQPWRKLVSCIASGKEKTKRRILVLSGPPGVGKSELAIRFLTAYKSQYCYAFFIDGSSKMSIQRDFLHHVRETTSSYTEASFEEAKFFFCNPKNPHWLLVYHNVNDEGIDLRPLLPICEHGTIIITTRARSFGELASEPVFHLDMNPMSEREALEVITRTSGQEISNRSTDIAATLVDKLGRLPLALSLAGSYIDQTDCSIHDYVEELQARQTKPLIIPPDQQAAYAAFCISYDSLPQHLRNLLGIIGCVHSTFPLAIIPFAAQSSFRQDHYSLSRDDPLFERTVQILEDTFYSNRKWDMESFNSMITTLRQYSLISIASHPNSRLLRIHPLLHHFLANKSTPQQKALFQSAAARLIACASKKYEWSHLLLPHIDALPVHLMESTLTMSDRAACAAILAMKKRYEEAKLIWKYLYESAGSLYGESSLEEATTALGFADTQREDLGEMELLEKEAIWIRETVLGPNHVEVYRAKRHLSNTYVLQKRDVEAVELQEEILNGLKQDVVSEEEEVCTLKHGLAALYHRLGRHDEAVKLMGEVLELRKRRLGERHPNTLKTMNQMVIVTCSYGDRSQAYNLALKTHAEIRRVHSLDHPDLVEAMKNLATTSEAVGKLNQAIMLQKSVLGIRQAQLAEDHLELLDKKLELANLHSEQGNHSEALVLQKEVIEKYKTKGDQDRTLQAIWSLVGTYGHLEQYSNALLLLEDLLQKHREMYQDDDPALLDTMFCLASVYSSERRYLDAQEMYREVMEKRKRILGDHTDTGHAMINLAFCYADAGDRERHSDARGLLLEAGEIFKRATGPDFEIYERIPSMLIEVDAKLAPLTTVTPVDNVN